MNKELRIKLATERMAKSRHLNVLAFQSRDFKEKLRLMDISAAYFMGSTRLCPLTPPE